MKNLLMIWCFFIPVVLGAAEVDDILDEADRIFELDRVYSRSSMIIYRSGEAQPTQILEGYTMELNGRDCSLTLFLEPRRVSGTAYLMIGDDLWVRFASTGRVRKLSSSAKKNSAGGSDFSYADMGEGSTSFTEDYSARLTGEERRNGENCHVVEFLPRAGSDAAYEKIVAYITVDSPRYLSLEYYDDGALIKVLDMEDYREVNGLMYPFRMIMTSRTRDSRTVMETDVLEFNSDRVREQMFSVTWLESM
jgi:hypothetical protein